MVTPTRFAIKRHYRALSEKETDAVVGAVADLIVTYLKKQSGLACPGEATATTNEPAERQEEQA